MREQLLERRSKPMAMEKYGEWAFIIGVILAIIAGLAAGAITAEVAGWLAVVFLILGVVVGFLNITDKEAVSFLVASIALLAAGAAAQWIGVPMIGSYIVAILGNIAAFVAPAAVIVALKAVWNMAKSA